MESVLSLLSKWVVWAQCEEVHATATPVIAEQDALGWWALYLQVICWLGVPWSLPFCSLALLSFKFSLTHLDSPQPLLSNLLAPNVFSPHFPSTILSKQNFKKSWHISTYICISPLPKGLGRRCGDAGELVKELQEMIFKCWGYASFSGVRGIKSSSLAQKRSFTIWSFVYFSDFISYYFLLLKSLC